MWSQQGVDNVRVFLGCFRQRLFGQYTHSCVAMIETKERYEFYSRFKCIFGIKSTYIIWKKKKKEKKDGVSWTPTYGLDLEYRLRM